MGVEAFADCRCRRRSVLAVRGRQVFISCPSIHNRIEESDRVRGGRYNSLFENGWHPPPLEYFEVYST
jgi:hypothetical protein